MEDWPFFLGLAVVTFVAIAIIVYFGRKLNKAVQTNASKINLPLNVTLAGNILLASVVGFWIICIATRVLAPASSMGVFLSDADGIGAVVIGSILFVGIAAEILNRFGYPIAKRGDGND